MIAPQDVREGIDRLRALLDDPETLAGIERFAEKLPEINATMELITGFLTSSSRMADNANGIVATAREAMGDTDLYEATERVKKAASTGARVAEDLGPALSDPETLESVKAIVEKLPRLVSLLQMLEQFLAGPSRFADNMNSIVSTARQAAESHWPDLLDRQGILSLPGQVLEIVSSPALRTLLASRVLSEGALHVMDQVADATVEAHQRVVSEKKRLTRFGAIKALGDPDVQRGLAMTIELSKALGRRIDSQSVPTPPSAR